MKENKKYKENGGQEMPKEKKVIEKQKGAKIGLISRIDAFGPNYRKGLVKLGFSILEEESAHFIIVAGGLVSGKSLKSEFPKKQEDQDRFIEEKAKYLADAIPRIKNGNGEYVKIYIITSPVYDGAIGGKIATRLAEIRVDIRYWDVGSGRNLVKQVNKFIHTLVPEKSLWRAEYYGAPIKRMTSDHQKRSTLSLAHMYICGCVASSILKPKGEEPAPYLSVPALCKLEETITAENQIGVRILEYLIGQEEALVRNYNFKDFISNERSFIDVPSDCSEIQKSIVDLLKQSPKTLGMIADSLKYSKKSVKDEIENFLKSHPSLIYLDGASAKYDFCRDYIQEKLIYVWPDKEDKEWKEESMLDFSCPHAGSLHTDYIYTVKKLPQIILRHHIRILVCAGDLIAGTKHNQLEKGEIIVGMNNTQQEVLAAKIIGQIIKTVFESRVEAAFKEIPANKKLSDSDVRKIATDALIRFIYKAGNHDRWQEDEGFSALTIFKDKLILFLNKELEKVLLKRGIHVSGLSDIIEEKIISKPKFQLESGICLEIFHPFTARAKNPTMKIQELFTKSDCQIIVAGNWHVAVAVEHWDPSCGQRVGLQVGTLMWKSQFEEDKAKKVDFGVGTVKVKVYKGRILVSEVAFYGADDVARKSFDNLDIIQKFEKDIGIEE